MKSPHPRKISLLVLFLALSCACEKPRPVTIPASADLWVTAESRAALESIPGIGATASLPEEGPVWYFCDGELCVAGAGQSHTLVAGTKADEAAWRVAEGPTLEMTHPHGIAARGRADWGSLLAAVQRDSKRGKELLARAQNQVAHIDFELRNAVDGRHVELVLHPNPAEPRFVETLGKPVRPLPTPGALVGTGVHGALRLSVDPEKLAAFGATLLTPAQRSAVEEARATAKTELRVDPWDEGVAALTGNVVIALYDVAEKPTLPALLAGDAASEVVWVGLREEHGIARFLDKLTQLSAGRLLQANRSEEGPREWVWTSPEGEALWHVSVGPDYLVATDGAKGLEHVREWMKAGPAAAAAPAIDLFEGDDASGVFLGQPLVDAFVPDGPWKARNGLVAKTYRRENTAVIELFLPAADQPNEFSKIIEN